MINNIVTEVIQLQYLRVLFVDKSWYFRGVYCANSVHITVHLVSTMQFAALMLQSRQI